MRLEVSIETQPHAPASSRFTSLLAIAVAIGLAGAVLISPIAAMLLAAAGLRFPFPRIFDRTVMVTLAISLLWFARPLGLAQLLRRGFDQPLRNFRNAAVGLLLALVAMAVLFTVAVTLCHGDAVSTGGLVVRAMRYVAAALIIAILEEGFFRAIILGGMARDWGHRTALVASSAIFALTHLVRSPARFYVAGLQPLAGLHNLGASLARVLHPGSELAMVFGLFLLGIVLGEALLLTERVYASIGMHMGFVLGAKTWPLVASSRPRIQRWIAGPGPVPLIAAPAAWALALVLLAVLPRTLKRPAA